MRRVYTSQIGYMPFLVYHAGGVSGQQSTFSDIEPTGSEPTVMVATSPSPGTSEPLMPRRFITDKVKEYEECVDLWHQSPGQYARNTAGPRIYFTDLVHAIRENWSEH